METLIGWFCVGLFYAIIVRVVSRHGKKIWILILFVLLGPMGLLGIIAIFILFIINVIQERTKIQKEELTEEQLESRRKRRSIIFPVTSFAILLICILLHFFITEVSPLTFLSRLYNNLRELIN